VTVWTGASVALLLTVALLVVPGVVIGLAARLKGPYLLGLAPALSVFVVSSTAFVTGELGLRWTTWWVVAGVVALGAPLAITLRLSSGQDRHHRQPELLLLAASVGGALAGGVLTAITVGRAIGSVEALSQTYDAVFHYNAVRLVLESGNASPLNIGTLNRHDDGSQFYPGAWHAFVSLVV
jgi:4-amino-4-deoxy-L-arabinose transferase-like glycosyltransferase